jgi:hypothetical protein
MHINKALKFDYVVGLVTIVTIFLIITMYNMLHMVSMAITGYKFYRTSVCSILRSNQKILAFATLLLLVLRIWGRHPCLSSYQFSSKQGSVIHTLKHSDGRTQSSLQATVRPFLTPTETNIYMNTEPRTMGIDVPGHIVVKRNKSQYWQGRS